MFLLKIHFLREIYTHSRSCHRRCSVKKGVLSKYHRKTPVSETLFKECLAQVFSYEFSEISKNTFLQNTSGRLLLSFEAALEYYQYSKWYLSSNKNCNLKQDVCRVMRMTYPKTWLKRSCKKGTNELHWNMSNFLDASHVMYVWENRCYWRFSKSEHGFNSKQLYGECCLSMFRNQN